jgi:prepilin-type N-terminal cleavage/methylation domain-containing protein
VQNILVGNAIIIDMNIRNLRSGFTFVELIVVIAIIGILSAVIYAGFGEAREQARNKIMSSELKEMQLAIEVYKAQNGSFPVATDSNSASCRGIDSGADSDWAISNGGTCDSYENIVDGLVPDFVAAMTSYKKSSNPNCEIEYQVEKDNQTWYKLTAKNCFAGASNASEGVQPVNELARCPTTCPTSGHCDPSSSDFYESFAVYSAGGECK